MNASDTKVDVRGVTYWLTLAAAPTFAIMALLTVVPGGGGPGMICPAAPDASPLTGMGAMYVLMSAFHSAPWLRLISRRATTINPGSERL